jgi:hypothetical protein
MAQTVTGLSLWGLGFNLRPVHVGFILKNMALQQVFLQALNVFSCQYHFTNVPYTLIHSFIHPSIPNTI